MFERLLKTTEDTEAHERGGAVPRAVCRAFDAVRGPPLQKPRVVTASEITAHGRALVCYFTAEGYWTRGVARKAHV